MVTSMLTVVRGGTHRPAPPLRSVCDDHPKYVAGCDGCRERTRIRRRARYRAVAYGQLQPGLVSTVEARSHIAALHDEHHISYRAIAAAAGVRQDAVTGIAAGTQMEARPRTVTAIIAVTPDHVSTLGRVPAVGAARRLQGLAADGYTAADIAPHLNTDVECVRRWRGRVNPTISARRHRDIAAVTERLSGEPGPSLTARANANRRGWVPLAAWDDIDNPAEQPQARDERHQHDARALINRVAAGNADIHILTRPEQVSLYRQWVKQRTESGLPAGMRRFAKTFGVGEFRASAIRREAIARPHRTTQPAAAERRSNERTAA